MFRIVPNHPKLLKMINVIQDGSNQFKMNNIFTNSSKYSKLLRIFQTLIKFSKWFQTCLMLLDKYKSKVFSFFLFFFHSVSNFLGASFDKALVSGSGSNIPLIQDIETSNSRAQLSHATLRFFSFVE